VHIGELQTMRNWIVGILLLSISPEIPIAVLHAASQQKYINQENIDASVMKGFYVLTEASSVSSIGTRQKDAIETAKRLAKELRVKAKGDPNERYILWKVGELESQIYLEEQDFILQKKMQGQITTNEYVKKYNAEVGKVRPDFATMKKIHTQMEVLDPVKANELADSYNKRYKAISREVIFSIEKAVMAGDDKKARDELGYCLRNKNYLSIDDSKYFQIENRVNGLSSAYQEKPLIEREIDSAENSIKHLELNQARILIGFAKYRLESANQYLPQNVSSRLSSDIDKVNKTLAFKEDSLVNINLSILSKQGFKAADAFLQKVLKPCGVARDKTAYVDSVILMISSPEKNKMAAEIESISQGSEDQNSVFNDIRETARKKAQAKVDSVRLADEITLRNIQAQKLKNDSIIEAHYEEQRKELQKNQENASTLTMKIYSFIEQNNIKNAEELFTNNQNFLRQYLVNDAFEILGMTITQLMEPADNQQVSYINPVSSPQSAAPAPKSDGSSPTEQAKTDDLIQKNQARAQQEIVGIYAMLEKNEFQTAFTKFQSIRKPLQKYLPKEAFDLLESTVIEAAEYSSETKK
jgi:hypothetical protein